MSRQLMEISLGDVPLTTSKEFNRFYDRIEEGIAETGENLSFFLIDYGAAWIALED